MEYKISSSPVDYQFSTNYMEKYVNNLLNNESADLAWILEHPSIYTYGQLSNKNDLINPNLFPTIKTKRGGQYTYHGPGQKVVYLMVNLNRYKKDIHYFINSIENLIINILSNVNIKAIKDDKYRGIFIKKNKELYKIASIGMKFKKWISFHGFSININPQLSHYKGIRPCGLDSNLVTSIENEGIKIANKDFDDIIISELKKIFPL